MGKKSRCENRFDKKQRFRGTRRGTIKKCKTQQEKRVVKRTKKGGHPARKKEGEGELRGGGSNILDRCFKVAVNRGGRAQKGGRKKKCKWEQQRWCKLSVITVNHDIGEPGTVRRSKKRREKEKKRAKEILNQKFHHPFGISSSS